MQEKHNYCEPSCLGFPSRVWKVLIFPAKLICSQMRDGCHGRKQSCNARCRVAVQCCIFSPSCPFSHGISKTHENLASGGKVEIVLGHFPPVCRDWGSTSMPQVCRDYGQDLNVWILCQKGSEDLSGWIFLILPQFVPFFPNIRNCYVCSPRFSPSWPHLS